MTTTDSAWDAQSYGLLAALQDYEGTLCPGCGNPLTEATDPMVEPGRPGATHRWHAHITGRCYACDSLSLLREQMSSAAEKGELRRPEAMHITTERVRLQPRPTRRG